MHTYLRRQTVVCSASPSLRVSVSPRSVCDCDSAPRSVRQQKLGHSSAESKTFYRGYRPSPLFNLYRSAIVLYAKIESAFFFCVRGKCAHSLVGTIFFSRNNFHCISVLVPRGKQRKSDVISKQNFTSVFQNLVGAAIARDCAKTLEDLVCYAVIPRTSF